MKYSLSMFAVDLRADTAFSVLLWTAAVGDLSAQGFQDFFEHHGIPLRLSIASGDG